MEFEKKEQKKTFWLREKIDKRQEDVEKLSRPLERRDELILTEGGHDPK